MLAIFLGLSTYRLSFIGSIDRTLCFHCGGELKDWLRTDDTWTEHAAWFPLCVYVRYTMGTTQVNECQKLRKTNRKRMLM